MRRFLRPTLRRPELRRRLPIVVFPLSVWMRLNKCYRRRGKADKSVTVPDRFMRHPFRGRVDPLHAAQYSYSDSFSCSSSSLETIPD